MVDFGFSRRQERFMNDLIMKLLHFFSLAALFINIQVINCSPCLPKVTRFGMVCVCNSTYCDTVEPNKKVARGVIAVYTSSKDGRRLKKTLERFSSSSFQEKGVPVFTIERNKTFQSILGFGGAFTDSTGINIAKLSSKTQSNLLRSYFSSDGIEYNIGRIPMASCDFSTRVYSYAESPGDFDLKNFSLAEEDHKYKIAYIKRAQALASPRTLRLFASPWSSPGWMKTNGNMTGGGTLIGTPGGKYYKTWAQYFVKFLEEYEKQNITLWGLTAENEPMEGNDPYYSFQCLGFTAESQRDFISQDLGPALHNAGFSHVKLMIMDDQRIGLPAWPKTVLQSASAAKYIAGIAVHWYMDQYFPATLLDQTHAALPNVWILATEACAILGGQPLQAGGWDNFEAYAHDIIEDLNHWVTGWTDWNMALDLQGGPSWVKNYVDSPILVNADHDEFYKQPTFYAMGHFSKFIPPNSVRISVNVSSKTSLQSVGFLREDGATVLVVFNREDIESSFVINDPHIGSIKLTVSPHSLQTYTWWY